MDDMEMYFFGNHTTDIPYDDRSFVEIVFGTVTMAVIIMMSICGNTLVLLAIWREKSLHNKTAIFIANLAIADLLNAAFCMTTILISCSQGEWILGNVLCHIIGAFTVVVCLVSINTLGAISLDRYFCIVSPFQYADRMSTRRIGLIMAWIWFQATMFGLCPVIGWSRYIFISAEYMCTADWANPVSYTIAVIGVNIVLPIIVMTYCYAYIFRVASVHRKQIKAQLKENRVNVSMDRMESQANMSTQNMTQRSKIAALTKRAKQLRKDTKAATTLLIVIGTFLLCWLPHSVTMLFIGFKVDDLLPAEVYVVSTWFAMSNSACNPFIYGITNKQFREAFKRTIDAVLPRPCKKHIRVRVDTETSLPGGTLPSFAQSDARGVGLDPSRLHQSRRLSEASDNTIQSASDVGDYVEKLNVLAR